MVKKLMKFFAYAFFFIVALMYFAPKVSAFYFLEEQLKPYGVIISSEKLNDTGFSLDIEDAVISFKSIESAKLTRANINVFVLYNTIHVEDITLSDTAASFVPLGIQKGDIRYSIVDPLHVQGEVLGDFGEADIVYDILQRSVYVTLKPSKLMLNKYRSTLRNFKKDENGEYVYEKTF